MGKSPSKRLCSIRAGLTICRKWLLLYASVLMFGEAVAASKQASPPNILLVIADDWGWPHAGAYGDPVVKTPAFDRIAAEGILFDQAFVASPSCTPSRNAILTGQDIWRLGKGANLYGQLDATLPVYPHLLAEAGYRIGHKGKAYGPGSLDNWDINPAGPGHKSFAAFLDDLAEGERFCFWQGSSDPHRGYREGSGAASGMDIEQVHLFGHFPDHPVIRSDIADYYFEVQRFDRLVDRCLAELESRGLLENTIVVVTGDHGMPFPRCKGNLYDSGMRVPLAMHWPGGVEKPGMRCNALVSLTDLAPTFLAAAGLEIPDRVTGRDLGPLLSGERKSLREAIVFGRERHTVCQEEPEIAGYPSRAIRTDRWLYIHNFVPSRWPAGTPDHSSSTPLAHRKGLRGWLGDCDNGPTKFHLNAWRDQPGYERYWQLSFGRRPEVELYDIKADPDALRNLADEKAHEDTRRKLARELETRLRQSGDPRVRPGGDWRVFEEAPYAGGVPTFPGGPTLKRWAPDTGP